jgi:antitoxin component YwqK of YwqJK toxin-antitoxin module
MKLKQINIRLLNGNISRQYFVNEKGELHGEFKDWYSNGLQSKISNYRNGLIFGISLNSLKYKI